MTAINSANLENKKTPQLKIITPHTSIKKRTSARARLCIAQAGLQSASVGCPYGAYPRISSTAMERLRLFVWKLKRGGARLLDLRRPDVRANVHDERSTAGMLMNPICLTIGGPRDGPRETRPRLRNEFAWFIRLPAYGASPSNRWPFGPKISTSCWFPSS